AHVAPEHACPQAGAEGLGAGLLGGKTLGIGFDPVGALVGLGAFRWRVDAGQKTLAVPLDGAFDAPDVDDVGTEPDDHVFSLRMISSGNRCQLFGIMRPPSCARAPWPRA